VRLAAGGNTLHGYLLSLNTRANHLFTGSCCRFCLPHWCVVGKSVLVVSQPPPCTVVCSSSLYYSGLCFCRAVLHNFTQRQTDGFAKKDAVVTGGRRLWPIVALAITNVVRHLERLILSLCLHNHPTLFHLYAFNTLSSAGFPFRCPGTPTSTRVGHSMASAKSSSWFCRLPYAMPLDTILQVVGVCLVGLVCFTFDTSMFNLLAVMCTVSLLNGAAILRLTRVLY
jgi:hypothetical protein